MKTLADKAYEKIKRMPTKERAMIWAKYMTWISFNGGRYIAAKQPIPSIGEWHYCNLWSR